MLQIGACIFMYFVLPLLGAVALFVINPRKIRLRWRLLILLFCSLWVAPFIAVARLVGGEDRIDGRAVLSTFLTGQLFLLWLLGLNAIGLFLRASYHRLRQRWSRAVQSAS